MKIHEVSSLDCSIPYNRKWLIKEVMSEFHLQEKPTKEKLQKMSEIITKKYGYKIYVLKKVNESAWYMSFKHINDYGFSIVYSLTKYEALCKFILLSKLYYKYDKKMNSKNKAKEMKYERAKTY